MIKGIAPVGLVLAIACNGGDGVAPTPVSSDISTMAVGEVRIFNPADIQNGIDLPSVSSARDFAIIVANTSGVHDVVANYVVKADVLTGASLGVSASPDVSPQSSMLLNRALLANAPQEAIEGKVRSFERGNLRLGSTIGPLSGFSAQRSTQVSTAPVPVVGDTLDVKIPDLTSNNLCTNFFQSQAVVASVSQKAILAVDTLDGPPSLLFTQLQLDSITQEFDTLTYPTDSSYFGNPTDVDANGRIILLFTGEVNKLTPRGQQAVTGGFFFAGDFFPPTDQGGGANSFCAQSNQAEIFYLLAPDPSGKFGDARSTSSVRQQTRGTIAHEFQHMINGGRRYQNPAVSSFESDWLNEALSHFAEDAVGRVQRSFTDLQTLSFNDLLPCPSTNCKERDDFNAFFVNNLGRLTFWMARPDTSSGITGDAIIQANLSSRGAAWALLRYAGDNYSSLNPRAFTTKLVAGPDTGVKNFTAKANASLDVLVSGWLVSMYADHLGIQGLDPNYQYRSYNFRSVMPPVAKAVLNQATATYPLFVQGIGSGSDNIPGTNRAGSGTYYRLSVPANSGAKNVRVLDAAGNNASFAGEHVYVLRVQ